MTQSSTVSSPTAVQKDLNAFSRSGHHCGKWSSTFQNAAWKFKYTVYMCSEITRWTYLRINIRTVLGRIRCLLLVRPYQINNLNCSACHHFCTAVLCWSGQLSKGDKSRINALFHKALKLGLCPTSLDINELIVTADKRLFGHISSKIHCLYTLPSSTAR